MGILTRNRKARTSEAEAETRPRRPGTKTGVRRGARTSAGSGPAAELAAVIGPGASSIQFVPEIQPHLGRLHVFQRTPPWIIPRTDRPLTHAEQRLFRALPAAQRAVRAAIYWGRELYAWGFTKPQRMRAPQRLARPHLERQITDPGLRARLTPSYTMWVNRIPLSHRS